MKSRFSRVRPHLARAALLGTLACLCLLLTDARAQPAPHKPPPPGARPPGARPPGARPPPAARAPWHGDIQRFHEHDWHVWRSGRWQHGSHAGRVGWWWVVGGLWYLYPAPVYPYPNPWEPPPFEYVTPPAGSFAPPPPPAQYWYYCESAGGYYPYVQACPGGWTPMPALPPK